MKKKQIIIRRSTKIGSLTKKLKKKNKKDGHTCTIKFHVDQCIGSQTESAKREKRWI